MIRTILVSLLMAVAYAIPAFAQVQPVRVTPVDPAGTAVYPFGSIAIGTSSSGVRVGPFGCYVTTGEPTYTTAQIHPCSLTEDGRIRVEAALEPGSSISATIGEILGPVVLPSGASTAAKQPALGTAGTPSADFISVQGSPAGAPVEVNLTDPSGSPLSLASDPTHDAAASTTGPQLMGACDDTATDAIDEGDAGQVRMDCINRQLLVRHLDPCTGSAKSFHVVNMSTATTVEIANAVASQFFYICSVNLSAHGAQTLAIGEDDTDGCGSMTAGLHGGATAATGWSFSPTGGITLGNGMGTVMKTGTVNRYLCVITGQAVQVSGTIAYVSAP